MNWILALALVSVPSVAMAERVSRAESGTAPCPDKAWRVLVIGGEIQPNSWCDRSSVSVVGKKGNNGKHLGWRNHQDAVRAEREAYRKKRDEERKSKDDERRASEEKKKSDESKRRSEEASKKSREAAEKKSKDDAKKKALSDEKTKDRKGCSH